MGSVTTDGQWLLGCPALPGYAEGVCVLPGLHSERVALRSQDQKGEIRFPRGSYRIPCFTKGLENAGFCVLFVCFPPLQP